MKKYNFKLYAKSHSVKTWVNIINDKFNDLEFLDRAYNISIILDIKSNAEIKKIDEASLIVFGRSLGVETFEDACKKLGQPMSTPTFIDLDETTSKKYLAEYKLTTIVKALNDDWCFDGEYRYSPYFEMKDGFFSFWGVNCNDTVMDGPLIFCLKTNELAEYMGRHYIDLYKEYYI